LTALLGVALPEISGNVVNFPDTTLVAELQRRLVGGPPKLQALFIVDDLDVLKTLPKGDIEENVRKE
jgi:hypothetical protein